MLSFLNIINLPLTQNSCPCCTYWRVYIPLLLEKKQQQTSSDGYYVRLSSFLFSIALFNFDCLAVVIRFTFFNLHCKIYLH